MMNGFVFLNGFGLWITWRCISECYPAPKNYGEYDAGRYFRDEVKDLVKDYYHDYQHHWIPPPDQIISALLEALVFHFKQKVLLLFVECGEEEEADPHHSWAAASCSLDSLGTQSSVINDSPMDRPKSSTCEASETIQAFVCKYQTRQARQVETQVLDASLDTIRLPLETESFDEKAPIKWVESMSASSPSSASTDSCCHSWTTTSTSSSPSPPSKVTTTALRIPAEKAESTQDVSAEELLRQSLEMLESAERQSLSYVTRRSPVATSLQLVVSEDRQDSECRPKLAVRFCDAIETCCVYDDPELTEKERARLFYSEKEIDFMCAQYCA